MGEKGKCLEPRNMKQLYYQMRKMKEESCYEDEETLLVYHSIMQKDYMPVYHRNMGNLTCLTRLPQLDHHFRQLLKQKCRICLNYDTTFRIGNKISGKRYASILTFRHPFLGGMPVVVLRYMFHDTKDEECHEILFRNLAESFPELVISPSVLITDREKSFKTERKRYFPVMAHIFCYLHIDGVKLSRKYFL